MGKSTDSYRATATNRFSYLDHGTHFEKPRLMGAVEVQLSVEGKGIFCHRLAKKVKRASN